MIANILTIYRHLPQISLIPTFVKLTPMSIFAGIVLGVLAWLFVRIILMGFYTVDQNERAVKTRFRAGRARPGQNHSR
jgi:hypothetical protein